MVPKDYRACYYSSIVVYCCSTNSRVWLPGQTLPALGPSYQSSYSASFQFPESPIASSSPLPSDRGPVNTIESVADVLQLLHSSLDKQLSTVCDKLDSVCSRMDILETRQKSLEEEVRTSTSLSSSTYSSPGSSQPQKRKRVTPTDLQVFTSAAKLSC